jgi:hypothetical protein
VLHPLGVPSEEPSTTATLLILLSELALLVTKSVSHLGNAGLNRLSGRTFGITGALEA